MYFVNRTKIEQAVYGAGRQVIWLKPGEGVEGEHYEQYSTKLSKTGCLTPEAKTNAKILGRPVGNQTAEAVAAALGRDPKLAAAVDAKREANAAAKPEAPKAPEAKPAPAGK